MRVLVTGPTGFVGRYLVEHLVERGDVVVGLSRSGAWPASHAGVAGRARIERFDLAKDREAALVEFLARKQPQVVYHLAAQSNPSLSMADPRGTWDVNLGGALTLFEALRRHAETCTEAPRPRVILVSSGVCYGNPPPDRLPVDELCPLRPTNHYAASKAAAELVALQSYLAFGTEAVIVRPFNHAGPGQSETYVLSSLCRQVAEVEAGLRPEVEHGNLDVVRDFTDVRDIVRAYRLLSEQGCAGEAYNIGTGRDVALSGMLKMLQSMARVPIPTRADPARMRPVDQPRLLANANKVAETTNWRPAWAIEQTLEDMLNYWRVSIRGSE
jgi:GDP-4-dehydro-6-deoxy-D-mannose reductase